MLNEMKKIAIIILAAGSSSRMGKIKQLLKVDNKTLLEMAIEAATTSNASAVFCILGANSEIIQKEIGPQNIDIIFNKEFNTGLSSSIAAAINDIEKRQVDIDAALIMLADQPEVNTEYLNKLIAVYQKNATKIIASNYNNNPGVPVIFPKKHFKNLALLKGDKGAKDFLKLHASETINIPRSSPLIDIDTKEEYGSLLKSI
jgi:molybdenum cofactor cytidylyltransferase